jgi:hypothetical protein
MNEDEVKREEWSHDQIERIWQLRLHGDVMFTNHSNFFLLCESILIVVISTLSSNDKPKKSILLAVTMVGFILTVIWIYVLGKQRCILNLLKKICKENMPEYKKYKEIREKKCPWGISNMWLLAYAVPILIGLLWLYLFFVFVFISLTPA